MAFATPPPVDARIAPLLLKAARLAPAAMVIAVARVPTTSDDTPAVSVAVFSKRGVDTPAPMEMAVALASRLRAAMEPSLRTPPAMVTDRPPATPSWIARAETPS